MTCFASFAKFIICGVNVAILIAVVVAAAVCYSNLKSDTDSTKYIELFKTSTAFQIFIGVIVVVAITTVIGCLLICWDPQWFRVVYFVFLFIVVVMEVVAIAIIAKYTDKTMEYIDEKWTDEEFKSAVNATQYTFNCCGFNNTTDDQKLVCESQGLNYTVTCYDALYTKVQENLDSFMYGTIALVVFQVVLVLLSFYWACCYKEEDHITDITQA